MRVAKSRALALHSSLTQCPARSFHLKHKIESRLVLQQTGFDLSLIEESLGYSHEKRRGTTFSPTQS